MALDRGQNIEPVIVVKENRSAEYMAQLNDRVESLKKEENDIKQRIAALKADYERDSGIYSAMLTLVKNDIADNKVIADREKDVLTLVNEEIEKSKDVILKDREEFSKYKAGIEAEIKANIDVSSAAIAYNQEQVIKLLKDANELKSVVARLSQESEALRGLNESLSALNTELDRKKNEKVREVSEIEAAVTAISLEIPKKQDEIKVLSASSSALAEDKARLQDQLNELVAERETINKERDANTKRAKELSVMANELKVEAQALANKNASLNKKEASLREAQSKV